MASSRTLEHAKIVLASVLSGRRDLMETSLKKLTPEHFPDSALRNIFTVVGRYSAATGAVVTRQAFADMLAKSGADAGTIALYAETFYGLEQLHPADHEFAWSLNQLQDDRAVELTGRALADALEQLTSDAAEIPKHLVGLPPHQRARAVALEAFTAIDRDLDLADSPEGDVRAEYQEMLQDYANRVAAAASGRTGVMSSVSAIDVYTSGLQHGDLAIVAAFTSSGKTQWCVDQFHDSAVRQGLNAVFFTSETVRSQVRRRLIARHSVLPQFGIPGGLNSRDLKAGTLTDDGVRQLQVVVGDLTANPLYGKMHIAQIPRNTTIGLLERQLASLQRQWDVDIVLIDYLALLQPERQRNSGWEELGGIVKQAKQLAVTHNAGRGVPVVSPWQISRTGYERASKTGSYALSDLSETAEIEKSSDVVMTLLRMSEETQMGRRVELKAQLLKVRDGPLGDVALVGDYATSVFSSPTTGGGVQDLLND